jgi:hypothetical protein
MIRGMHYILRYCGLSDTSEDSKTFQHPEHSVRNPTNITVESLLTTPDEMQMIPIVFESIDRVIRQDSLLAYNFLSTII